jgi:predicted RNase H-related nuclease YkuK (DUF458 family)
MPTISKEEISSRELMEEIIARAAIEVVQTIKSGHKGNENLIMREIKGLHSNTTLADLSPEVQAAVRNLAQAMFGYINRQGYVLIPKPEK